MRADLKVAIYDERSKLTNANMTCISKLIITLTIILNGFISKLAILEGTKHINSTLLTLLNLNHHLMMAWNLWCIHASLLNREEWAGLEWGKILPIIKLRKANRPHFMKCRKSMINQSKNLSILCLSKCNLNMTSTKYI